MLPIAWTLLAALAAQQAFLCCGQIISVPLYRTKSPRQQMAEVGTSLEDVLHAEHPMSRYAYLTNNVDGYFGPGKPKPKPKTNDSVALFKFLNSEFYGVVGIGKPAQPMTVVFDTAWGNSWVPSNDCSWFSIPCLLHRKYNHKKSTTYFTNGKKFDMKIGSSDLSGYLSTDIVNIGHLTIKNQTFAEVSKIPLIYSFSKADGVFGMGYTSLAIDGVVPFFYNIMKQKLVAQPIFSFYMNMDYTSDRGGNLFLGGSDPKHYNGSLTFVPVTKKLYWQFNMDGLYVQVDVNTSVGFCNGGCPAILDTSTTVISGPVDEVTRINSILGATSIPFGRYKVDCNTAGKLPEMSVAIAGKNFTLKARNYIQEVSWGGFTICLSAFAPTDLAKPYDKLWALGAAFLGQYYTEFDLGKNRIGFAPSYQSG